MDERPQFVARRLVGESMAELCPEFGNSPKAGYEIFDRYPESGLQGVTDCSRRSYRNANRLPFQGIPGLAAAKVTVTDLARFSVLPAFQLAVNLVEPVRTGRRGPEFTHFVTHVTSVRDLRHRSSPDHSLVFAPNVARVSP